MFKLRAHTLLRSAKPPSSGRIRSLSQFLPPENSDHPPGAESLLSCTVWRWLNNEATQRSLRRLDFNMQALCDAGAKAVGATECETITLLGEGGMDRLFSLYMNNGVEVVARLPFPIAGPQHLMTRSEVATMDFLRTRFNALVPKVLAWQASKDNPVGCEYVIMERCPGEVLAFQEGGAPRALLAEVSDLQIKLAAVPFSQYGSIYYKEDVSPNLQSRPFYAEGFPEDECSERFRIGPSVERRFYRSERAHMRTDRGPWRDVSSYIRAIATCEMNWIRSCADTPQGRMQLGHHHTPAQHISALEKWLRLAPAILPREPEFHAPTLFHPDLHPANIMPTVTVHPPSPIALSGIIDWQGVAIRPLFEAIMPSAFEVTSSDLKYLDLTRDFEDPHMPDADNLNAAKNSLVESELKRVWVMYKFLASIKEARPALYTAMRDPSMDLLRQAIYFSSHSWSDGLPNLERVLMIFCEVYGDGLNHPTHPDYPECPISFSQKDKERIEQEFETVVGLEMRLEGILQNLLARVNIKLHPDGRVLAEDFEAAQKEAMYIRADMERLADDCAKGVLKRIWPLREGKFVTSAESCI
ncbi:hypothetical protein BOTBODRAFT_162342 [Botryobasidium botryosum FD-172 SS1]|uniref:Altered inheritance of mitochondria protein 9, mitochondrial n=1 Tax=Botryobasidium botryosum (strain FD-172 SS1) TaxID=930990 RepID=A0A067M810_BOTB1|nr:hypothetical protein BOTBODRAFT_162342 [Botryobasidium botryosum FD-172 SS1]